MKNFSSFETEILTDQELNDIKGGDDIIIEDITMS